MSHTPGPWRVAAGIVDNPRLIVEDDIGNPVCAMSLRGVYGDTVKMTANAALIAAAPEILAILEELRESSTCCGTYDLLDETTWASPDLADRIESAIRKARGEE